MDVDVRLFATHLAPAFGITKRFVGHEPYCETTAGYNRTMADVLPQYGIRLVEVERAARGGRFVSATDVRAGLAAGDVAAIEGLVPPTTLAFLQSPEGAAIGRTLAESQERIQESTRIDDRREDAVKGPPRSHAFPGVAEWEAEPRPTRVRRPQY
jgi:citrate lyase synthetase